MKISVSILDIYDILIIYGQNVFYIKNTTEDSTTLFKKLLFP